LWKGVASKLRKPFTEVIERRLKKLFCFLVIVLLGFPLACGTGEKWPADRESPVYHLVVLHTNDTHGHPVKFFNASVPDVGGLPARATLVKQIRSENENVLVLDAGDLNTGKAVSNFFKAKPDIEGYNYIGYDAMVLGNHEFDNPRHALKGQMALACFPFLSANVKTSDGQYLAKPYIIREFDGFKVAVFGLTTKETEQIGNPEYIKDLLFEDEIEVAGTLVPELRKQADVVIALVHMGIYRSSRAGSKRLAWEVSGIDLVVDGHTHTRLDLPILIRHVGSDDKTIIVQAWQWGLVLGRVDLWIQNKSVIDFRFEPIPINLKRVEKKPDGTKVYRFIGEQIEEDEKLLTMLQPYVDQAESMFSKVIGHAEGTFFKKDLTNGETALGNIIADSMLWRTKRLGVDFAIQNGGGIRGDLPRGPITMQSIHEILPFDNSVVVLTLKGYDVQSLFDYIATVPIRHGAFPQVSEGLSFTINRVAQKCENIHINGNRMDPDRTYRIVTNSFLASGGDGYKMFLNAVGKYDSSILQRDVLIEYIKYLGGSLRPKETGRINITSDRSADIPLKQAA
jgi:5'-nucleotidase/UDP-sugar diphosphatase